MPRALGRGRGRAPKREENWVVLHRDSPGGERGVGGEKRGEPEGNGRRCCVGRLPALSHEPSDTLLNPQWCVCVCVCVCERETNSANGALRLGSKKHGDDETSRCWKFAEILDGFKLLKSP